MVALFYAVGYWNNFFNALLYLNDSAMWPLQLVLRLYVVQGAPLPSAGDVAENAPPLQSIQMAVVVVAMIPILCVYPFLQRYFTRGVLSARSRARSEPGTSRRALSPDFPEPVRTQRAGFLCPQIWHLAQQYGEITCVLRIACAGA